ILLGVLNLTGVLQRLQERRFPTSSATDMSPLPTNQGLWLIRLSQTLGRYNALRPLIIGIVHGLAGSAAVALLVMVTIHDLWWSIAYLLLFGIGTVAGMMLITAVIAMPFVFTARKFSGWNRKMALASGLLSLGFGVFLSYQIGFVDGLFTSHPSW